VVCGCVWCVGVCGVCVSVCVCGGGCACVCVCVGVCVVCVCVCVCVGGCVVCMCVCVCVVQMSKNVTCALPARHANNKQHCSNVTKGDVIF